MGMTQQTRDCGRGRRPDLAFGQDAIERANLDAGWRRFRD